MTDEVIPEDIRQFILQNIDSIAQLEGLLLIRNDQQAKWNIDIIAKRLYITQQEAAQLLSNLAARGFLVAKGDTKSEYYYKPKMPELEETVKCLAELYSRYLVPITNLIHSKPRSKVQVFADAFRIRKD